MLKPPAKFSRHGLVEALPTYFNLPANSTKSALQHETASDSDNSRQPAVLFFRKNQTGYPIHLMPSHQVHNRLLARDFCSRMLVMVQPEKSKRISAWNLLLILPVLGLAFPGVYARATPELAGVPFFYWYQFAWIVLTGIITAIVYKTTSE